MFNEEYFPYPTPLSPNEFARSAFSRFFGNRNADISNSVFDGSVDLMDKVIRIKSRKINFYLSVLKLLQAFAKEWSYKLFLNSSCSLIGEIKRGLHE